MINNFEDIEKLLEFRSEDDFYLLFLSQRKKEHPELGSKSRVVKSYYITSKQKLEELRDEIVIICNALNCRAYIHLNRRSFKKAAIQTLGEITSIILNESYKKVGSAYLSVLGKHHNEENKTYLVDIDSKDFTTINRIVDVINLTCKPENKTKFKTLIETKNGYHLIAEPFDVAMFKKYCPDIDVHKNNPTILYVP